MTLARLRDGRSPHSFPIVARFLLAGAEGHDSTCAATLLARVTVVGWSLPRA